MDSGQTVSIPIPTQANLQSLRTSFNAVKNYLSIIQKEIDILNGNGSTESSAVLISQLGPDWPEVLGAQAQDINAIIKTYTYSATVISNTMPKADVKSNVIILEGTVTANAYLSLFWAKGRGSKIYTVVNKLSSATDGKTCTLSIGASSIVLPIHYTGYTLRESAACNILIGTDGSISLLNEAPLVETATAGTGYTFYRYQYSNGETLHKLYKYGTVAVPQTAGEILTLPTLTGLYNVSLWVPWGDIDYCLTVRARVKSSTVWAVEPHTETALHMTKGSTARTIRAYQGSGAAMTCEYEIYRERE